jgi:hypothetical protein
MSSTGEVTIERGGKQYGSTYAVSNGMLHVKTHTETRSLELGDQDPGTLARDALIEIINAQSES